MPENNKPVKQVSVYNGSNWDTHDIGANAKNITLSSINIGKDVQTAFHNLIGSNTLGGRQIVFTDQNGLITTNSYSPSLLENLNNTTVIENQGVLDNNASIKKLKQKDTNDIILPETKTSAVYMPNNITTLDEYLGSTDISTIGNGTITGALDSLNTNLYNDTYGIKMALGWWYPDSANGGDPVIPNAKNTQIGSIKLRPHSLYILRVSAQIVACSGGLNTVLLGTARPNDEDLHFRGRLSVVQAHTNDKAVTSLIHSEVYYNSNDDPLLIRFITNQNTGAARQFHNVGYSWVCWYSGKGNDDFITRGGELDWNDF